MRFRAVFIALCIVVTAGSLGSITYLLLGFSGVEALASGITVLSMLSLFQAVASRSRERADLDNGIVELSRGISELAHQVGDFGRRLAVVEQAQSQAELLGGSGRLDDDDPLMAEMDVLGTLVKQLAESVAAHEARLLHAVAEPRAAPTTEQAETPVPPALPHEDLTEPALTTSIARKEPERTDRRRVPDTVEVVRNALQEHRLDLYLQPIVTLPQRKIRFYEALSRLRTQDGILLAPPDFLMSAEAGGLMPQLDRLVLGRCVQVVRRLAGKSRDIGLFCNIHSETLGDAAVFPQVLDLLVAHCAVAPALVLEFTQDALRNLGPIEQASLSQLAELGYRFSMDRVGDLQIEPRKLAEMGVRFIKLAATLMLGRGRPGATDIHPTDFSDLLGRYGIDLIVERIESEGMVVDLLDYDVRFGQGFLFSPPRPVRAEAFQPLAEQEQRPVTTPAQTGAPLPVSAAASTVGGLTVQREAKPLATPEKATGGLAKLARNIVRRA